MTSGEIVQAEQAGEAAPLQGLIERYGDEFGKILPAHIGQERYVRWSVGLLRKAIHGPQADKWQHILSSGAGQASVMQALMDCATLGLEPGREYHLVPFGNEVTGITDYKGEIRLITNAARCTVIAMLVRKGDRFAARGANYPPHHDADWFSEDRGPVVGGYAYVDYGTQRAPATQNDVEQLNAGVHLYSLVVTMSEAEFLQHRDKARTKTVWDEWPDAMRLKTLVHTLKRWVQWAPEYRP